ncbi:hypothetical protein CF327_g126 [Tilletia walkeri]|nr:hypothetical protein CF327_g126 [Tilletia walkeri]
MSIAVRPLTYNAYHNPVTYEEPGRPLNLPNMSNPSSSSSPSASTHSPTKKERFSSLSEFTREQLPYPALHLFSLNNTFAPKHILLGPPTVTPHLRLKIGRQTSQKTAPHPSNTYFDSKVLSRTHAELWSENGKIYIRDLRSSNGTFINGNRLSPEGCESDACEIKNEDLIEFGIDIVAEDGQAILHHKVAARAFTILDAHAADRAQHDWTNLYRFATLGMGMGPGGEPNPGGSGPGGGPGGNGAGQAGGGQVGVGPGGSIMGPGAEGGLRRTKGGKSFDHVIALLQAEMSRLSASGMSGPEAAAARAVAAAKHRERVANARSSRTQDSSQGSDGAPLSPLDETAQKLNLLLSSLSATRSQLDALRAAAHDGEASSSSNDAEGGAIIDSSTTTKEEDLTTVTPNTPASETSEEDALNKEKKKEGDDASAESDAIGSPPSPATQVPTTAAAAIERLPALRTSLSTLLSNVYEARAKALTAIRERQARTSDEELAGTSMRPPPSQRNGLHSGGSLIRRGLRLSVFDSGRNLNGGDGGEEFDESTLKIGLPPLSPSAGGQNGMLGSPPKEPLPSLPPEAAELDGPLRTRSGSSSGASMMGAGGSVKRQHMTGQLRMSSVRRSSIATALRLLETEENDRSQQKQQQQQQRLPVEYDSAGRPGRPRAVGKEGQGPPPASPMPSSISLPLEDEGEENRLPPPSRPQSSLFAAPPLPPPPGLGQGEESPRPAASLFSSKGAGAGKKRSADEHFEVEDEEAEREAEALHGLDGGHEQEQVIPEGVSISVQGSGSAPSSSSSSSSSSTSSAMDSISTPASSPFGSTEEGEEATGLGRSGSMHADEEEEEDGGKKAVETRRPGPPNTITAARLDRAEATLEELRARLETVQRARGGGAAQKSSSSRPSSASASDAARELVARLDRLERKILVKDESSAAGDGGLGGLRERWLGCGNGGAQMVSKAAAAASNKRTKAELVWDGLQTKFGTPAGAVGKKEVVGGEEKGRKK